ncbi:MAG: ABC transporter permease, partial [Acidobacteria bacterium]|nr:ABC transporter permease [Acidobacteriota bacterium]
MDLRYACRLMLRSPGFALVAVLTLALGIGAASAIFTVVDGILLRDLPYQDPNRLVLVWDNFLRLQMEEVPATAAEFFDYRGQNRVFADVAAFRRRSVNITGGAGPERIAAASVSAGLFPLLGVRPATGRGFLPEEDSSGRDNVVVLSHELWLRRFGGDPSPLGQKLILGGKVHTVVGIMPPGFQFRFSSPSATEPVELWLPMGFTPEELAARGGGYNNILVARLKPGITLEKVRREMEVIAGRLELQYPQNYRGPRGAPAGWRITVVPLREQITGRVRPALLVLLGAVGLLLLIACANVANLLLARVAARQREMAIREALGAGRLRLLRQFLVESLLLCVLGGALGLLVAYWGLDLLLALRPADLPRLEDVAVDRRVLLFATILSLLTGVVFGLLPVFARSARGIQQGLGEGRGAVGGFGRQRAHSLLIVSEMALSLVLLIGAGLLARSFARLLRVNPGFDPSHLLTARIDLPASRYPQEQQRAAFFEALLEQVGTLAGVESASLVSNLPLTPGGRFSPFTIEGRPYDPNRRPPVVGYRVAGDAYFRTMGIPLVAGRLFNEHDDATGARVLVINNALARSFFPDEDPIGKRVKLGGPSAPSPWLMIVGVVGDVRLFGLDSEPGLQMYVPHRQEPSAGMTVVVRASRQPSLLQSTVPAEVVAIDREQPVTQIRTMEEVLADSVAGRRFQTLLVGVFASVGLLLAATGIYGVMAYAVSRRTQEIGIRMALGAQRGDVVRMILGEALVLSGMGVALGLAAAFGLTRFLRNLLYGVAPTDPATFVGVPLVLSAVALLAAFIPARRAAQLDPMAALIFSVVRAVLLRALPYREPDRIILVWTDNPAIQVGFNDLPPSNADMKDWQSQNHVFERLAAFASRNLNLSAAGEPERVGGAQVTAELIPLLGVEPSLGRVFTADEDQPGKNRVVLLSHGLWQRRFGSDPSLVGKSITLDGIGYTVIGIMPPGFGFPRAAELPAAYNFAAQSELWVPLALSAEQWNRRDWRFLVAMARLKPAVSLPQAQAEMSAIARRLAQDHPESNAGWIVKVVPLEEQI